MTTVRKTALRLSASLTISLCFLLQTFVINATEASALSQQSNTIESVLSSQMPSYSIYAAHISDDVRQSCELNSSQACKVDFLTSQDYKDAFEIIFNNIENDTVTKLNVLLVLGEYELLASVAQFSAETVYEYTVNWRGVPIYEASIPTSYDNQNENLFSSIALLMTELESNDVLSSEYLFSALGASDYGNELIIPSVVENFSLEQTQLQANPTAGVLARYRHDDFPSALVDLHVYPVLQHNFQQRAEQLINNELQKDISQLVARESTAEISQLSTSNIELVKFNSPLQNNTLGAKFSAEAEEEVETLYTTQYVFLINDKFVKFSANMPEQFARPMIEKVMSQISVPQASEIMNAFREVDKDLAERHEQVSNQTVAALN